MGATLADIARETGFARSSVAEVLQGRPGYSAQTRQRILDAARRLDFVPNHLGRSLKKQRSHTIGVAARMVNAMNTGLMLHAIADALLQRGFMPLFAETSGPSAGEAAAIRELRARSVDGMLIAGDLSEQQLNELVPAGLPLVMIRTLAQPGRTSVVADRFEAYHGAVRWLAERGHRRIALLGHDREALKSPFNSLRRKIEGYQAAMSELKLDDPDLLIEPPREPGASRRFVAEHRELFTGITAILAANDRLALEAISGLSDLGLQVPRDCSVIGFDDTPFAVAMKPTLTSFDPRHAEVGRCAVQMLMDLLEGKQPQTLHLAPRLIVRESVRALR